MRACGICTSTACWSKTMQSSKVFFNSTWHQAALNERAGSQGRFPGSNRGCCCHHRHCLPGCWCAHLPCPPRPRAHGTVPLHLLCSNLALYLKRLLCCFGCRRFAPPWAVHAEALRAQREATPGLAGTCGGDKSCIGGYQGVNKEGYYLAICRFFLFFSS